MLLLLLACTRAPEPEPLDDPFPEDFAWGAATAGFQVDMGCPTWSAEVCDDTASDWYQFVTHPDFIADGTLHVSGEPVSAGPGMWELFEEDVARMKADGLDVFRMSLEWSRLFPTDASAATTVDALDAYADPDAVARYHEQLGALRAAGLEPLVTLNHYTLPLWVHDAHGCYVDLDSCERRGWVDAEVIVPQIALYAGWCAREFGGEVDTWATLNEPLSTTLSGYLQPNEERSHPPGISMNVAAAVATLRSQVEGSAAMFDAVHAHDVVDADGDGTAAAVGLVLNMAAVHPVEDDDAQAVEHMDFVYHRVFLDGLTDGAWDDDLDGTFDRTRPELAGRLDFIGVNYYVRVVVRGLPFPLLDEVPVMDFYPEYSWEPYPEGLGEVVARAAEYGLPIWVTENGTPDVEAGVGFLEDHLVSLHGAIDAGADVRGYLWWSYVDNYEWNHGMDMRFGLYALDLDTKERTARPVLERYRQVIEDGGL